MINIEKLSQGLTYDEYAKGRDLYTAARKAEISASKAAALCYRAGYQAGKDSLKERIKEAYRRLAQERKLTSILAEVDRAAKEPDVMDTMEVSSDD